MPNGNIFRAHLSGDVSQGFALGWYVPPHPGLQELGGRQPPPRNPERTSDLGYYDADEALPSLVSDDELARYGGLSADDRVEVVPWLEKEDRFSFASSDSRAIDLKAFKGLTTGK